MAVNRPTYATRRLVKAATDITTAANYDNQVDSALEEAADDIDGLCHRRFYNVLTTAYFDWPNFQYAYPWRVWFDERELADVIAVVPAVKTGSSSIPNSAVFYGPWNYAPPYTFLELDRSQSYSFGDGPTPQRNVSVTGLFGYWNKTQPAGALAVAVSSTTSTSFTVSDSSLVDVGNVLTVGTESCLVRDNAMANTGQTQSGSGCSTATKNDNALTVADGTQLHVGEVIQLDTERLLITSITGNVATVIRAYDGSVISTHSNAPVYALRALTVTRGDFGTTAATHLISAALTVPVVPGAIRELAVAEATNTVHQKISAYARETGAGDNKGTPPGGSLPELREKVLRSFGRKHRQAVI